MSIDVARKVADAVLYEGYVLYPYRASSQKNQVRWQWGVLLPRPHAEASGEAWRSRTECLVEPGQEARLQLKLRFLQVQHKQLEKREGDDFKPVDALEVGAEHWSTWDEGVEQESDAEFALAELLDAPCETEIVVPGDQEVEPVEGGRVVRTRWPVSGLVRAAAERIDGPYGLVRIRVDVENGTPFDEPGASRDIALRHSLVAAHLLLAVTDGAFVSPLDHPEWAAGAVAACENTGMWPVLVGEEGSRDVMLSSPIILYDYPQIAPESPGELFDGTEIDEILSLRTMALTDEEKRQARGTDPRAARLIDRVDNMPPEILERLHGTVRYLEGVTGEAASAASAASAVEPGAMPWWDPGADESVSPETDHVMVGAVQVARGSQVRLKPGLRRTDAQDMFLAGRIARVEAVLSDVDDNTYLAVTLTDDPGADLQQWHGRFLYFHPDEVEPL